MCGISGIVGQGWQRKQLEEMVRVQHHRGPDDNGVYVNANATVGLGHNRLSIIDLSPAGHQPMFNHDSRLCIAFNGEVYNYRELRSELKDYPFRSKTDTEVVLAAYERWGDECVQHFIGMFAFAIWDESKKRLFCARDRLGIKPFHYALHDGKFLFASEIKALLAAGMKPEANMSTWATYLAHGYYDHSAETFFKNASCLPAGHCLLLHDGSVEIKCYWDLPSIVGSPLELSDNQAAAQFLELMGDAVSLRLRSDVPLGVNLSGGLDSASLMMTVDRLMQSKGELQTFTSSFDDAVYDEEEFANSVPRIQQWARHVQRLNSSHVFKLAEELNWHQEAPFGGIATLAYFNLHKLAAEHGITVLLEGQGVDEMLAGYAYFRAAHNFDLLKQGRYKELRGELRADPAGSVQSLVALRHKRDGVNTPLYQDGTNHLRLDTISQDLIEMAGLLPTFSRPFERHLENDLYRDLRYTKLPRVLRMNDRLSMACSRELREPYLDHRIVEFLFRLPAQQKIRSGRSKFLLRHAMQDKVPDKVRLANKRAVVTPQREWLRSDLRPDVEELIYSREFRERGLFNAKSVAKAYSEFCNGKGENSFFVWQWINVEMWFRRFENNDHYVPVSEEYSPGKGITNSH